jgi:hypothetical protein
LSKNILLFPEKEAKSVVLLCRKPRACLKGANLSKNILPFPEKEAKSVVLLRRRSLITQLSAKPTPGVWDVSPGS